VLATHTPTEINLNCKMRVLTVSFDDGESFAMSCEYLRVHSPSAEVQGMGRGKTRILGDVFRQTA